MYSYGSPHTAAQKQDDQHERTFSSYVRIQVVVLKTCLGRWTIGRSGERGSGISVLPARYDDDDESFYWLVFFFMNVFNLIIIMACLTNITPHNDDDCYLSATDPQSQPSHTFKIKSSSSSSCRAASTDIPDPLSPLLPIIHRLW